MNQDENLVCPNCEHVIDRNSEEVVSVFGKLFCKEKCFRQWSYQEPKTDETTPFLK